MRYKLYHKQVTILISYHCLFGVAYVLTNPCLVPGLIGVVHVLFPQNWCWSSINMCFSYRCFKKPTSYVSPAKSSLRNISINPHLPKRSSLYDIVICCWSNSHCLLVISAFQLNLESTSHDCWSLLVVLVPIEIGFDPWGKKTWRTGMANQWGKRTFNSWPSRAFFSDGETWWKDIDKLDKPSNRETLLWELGIDVYKRLWITLTGFFNPTGLIIGDSKQTQMRVCPFTGHLAISNGKTVGSPEVNQFLYKL